MVVVLLCSEPAEGQNVSDTQACRLGVVDHLGHCTVLHEAVVQMSVEARLVHVLGHLTWCGLV